MYVVFFFFLAAAWLLACFFFYPAFRIMIRMHFEKKIECYQSDQVVPAVIHTSHATLDQLRRVDIRNQVGYGWRIKLYSDDDCEKYISECYNDAYARWFRSIPDGPIKGDFFRVLVLFNEGGVWLDADMELITNMNRFRVDQSSLSIVSAPMATMIVNPFIRYNPTVLASPPGHCFIGTCIHVYEQLFTGVSYSYWAYSLVTISSAVSFFLDKHLCPATPWHEVYCPGKNYEATIRDTSGKLLAFTRGSFYDCHRHTFR